MVFSTVGLDHRGQINSSVTRTWTYQKASRRASSLEGHPKALPEHQPAGIGGRKTTQRIGSYFRPRICTHALAAPTQALYAT
ncbi:hypothetical protein ACI3PL_24530, partial [Lacticaseibacillus paracasei]